jgi:hypothetical protein
METVRIDEDAEGLDFLEAKARADREAGRRLADPVCLSWYDRAENREAPAHVSECRDGCDVPGYQEYAVSRGGELVVEVGGGAYVFCYRPLGEFSEG